MEIWKPVKNYEGIYEVSNLGRIKSLHKHKGTFNRILKSNLRGGYLCVTFYKNNLKKSVSVHKIISIAFIENKNNKPCVNHINGIKTDNRIENLEWCTISENNKHAYDNNLNKAISGELHYKSKLTDKQVIEIFNSSLKQKELSLLYNVNQVTISKIKLYKSHKRILLCQ